MPGTSRILDMTSTLSAITALVLCGAASAQSPDSAKSERIPFPTTWQSEAPPPLEIFAPTAPQRHEESDNSQASPQGGFLARNLRSGLQDQKQLYSSPFRAKNLKWDALFLVSTAGLLAADRHISRAIPNDHVNISHDVALTLLLGTSAATGGTWLYGLKTGDRHADETGVLTLESLANTFLVYTPMQLMAGRERPDEGTGNGRFRQHFGLDTSFPGGHAMFTWSMASVIAHEYPKRWVKFAAYGAAFSVSATRLTGRNHFASDIWVGSILGYLIGTRIFHAHCDPQFSPACPRP